MPTQSGIYMQIHPHTPHIYRTMPLTVGCGPMEQGNVRRGGLKGGCGQGAALRGGGGTTLSLLCLMAQG